MDPTDVSDVTGTPYSYLIDEITTLAVGLFAVGERVRLRVVDASSMTNFNVRIPGLKLTVVQADGQNVRWVAVDELQIAVAETDDLIAADRTYGLIAEAVDRSGQVRATLAPRDGMGGAVPPIRRRPVLTMRDMGDGHVGSCGARDGHGYAQPGERAGSAAQPRGRDARADAGRPDGRAGAWAGRRRPPRDGLRRPDGAGGTARFARAAGEEAGVGGLVLGVRAWF